MKLKYKGVIWVSAFSIIFLFIPSLAQKVWSYLLYAPWQAKSWVFYILLALLAVFLVSRRFRKKRLLQGNQLEQDSLLGIAKKRLVKGEISIEEFRRIRQELKEG